MWRRKFRCIVVADPADLNYIIKLERMWECFCLFSYILLLKNLVNLSSFATLLLKFQLAVE